MPPSITANPDFVCVGGGVGSGKSATTEVSYNSGSNMQIEIWELRTQGSLTLWGPGQIKIPDPRKGKYQTDDQTGGTTVEIMMVPAGKWGLVDPLVKKKVYFLTGKPATLGFDEIYEEFGGTYYLKVLTTGESLTYAKMILSQRGPEFDPCGTMVFAPNTPMFIVDSPRGTTHELEISGLTPGTFYYRVIQVSDDAGFMKQTEKGITTLRRRINVNISKIHIVDDGDTYFTGEANFSCSFSKVGNQPPNAPLGGVKSDLWPPSGTVTVDSGTDIPGFTGFSATANSEGDWTLRTDVFGDEQDIKSEHAEGWHIVSAPSGRFQERVSSPGAWVKTSTTRGSFKFNCFLSYQIDYV